MTEWAVEIDDLVKNFGSFVAVDHVDSRSIPYPYGAGSDCDGGH